MEEECSKTIFQLALLEHYPSHFAWRGGTDPNSNINYGLGANKRIELIEEKLKDLCQYELIDKKIGIEFKKIAEEYCRSLNKWKQVFEILG